MLLIKQSDSELEDDQLLQSKVSIGRKAMTGGKGNRNVNKNRQKENKYRKKAQHSLIFKSRRHRCVRSQTVGPPPAQSSLIC